MVNRRVLILPGFCSVVPQVAASLKAQASNVADDRRGSMHVDRNKNRSASGVKQAARGNETAMDRIDLCVVKSFERFNNHHF